MFILFLTALVHATCSTNLSAANDNDIHRTLLASPETFAWSEDGGTLVYRTLKGWQVKGTLSREPGVLLPRPSIASPLSVSRQGLFTVFRGEDGDSELFATANERRLLKVPASDRLIFSQTGRTLVRLDPLRGDVTIYDLGSMRQQSRFRLLDATPQHPVWGAQYDDDMNRLLVKYASEDPPAWIQPLPDGYIERRAYEPPTGRELHLGERYLATSAASRYARYVVFTRGTGAPGSRFSLDAYEAVTGRRVGHANLRESPTAIAFSSDERRVAIATTSSRVFHYALPRLGRPRRTWDFSEFGRVDHLAFVRGQWLAFFRRAGRVVAF